MSVFSDEMAAISLELITEYGETGSFERVVQGDYDPDSADTLFDTITTYSGSVVPSQYKNSEIDGTLIQRGDFKILAHNMTSDPAVGDSLTFGDISCKIVSVNLTRVNGVTVLFTLQGRV